MSESLTFLTLKVRHHEKQGGALANKPLSVTHLLKTSIGHLDYFFVLWKRCLPSSLNIFQALHNSWNRNDSQKLHIFSSKDTEWHIFLPWPWVKCLKVPVNRYFQNVKFLSQTQKVLFYCPYTLILQKYRCNFSSLKCS